MSGKYLIRATIALAGLGIACGQKPPASPQSGADPNTGQVTKVSSSNTYTWLDSSGKVSYQTNNVNADPNGARPGTWTRQQQVHGDGTGK